MNLSQMSLSESALLFMGFEGIFNRRGVIRADSRNQCFPIFWAKRPLLSQTHASEGEPTSLFDQLDYAILETETHIRDAIERLKANGHKTWPDGRKLEDVIRTK